MNNKKQVTAIILAAGKGSRMNSSITKQKIALCGKSLLYRSVERFVLSDSITDIIVACREDEIEWAREELSCFSKPIEVISGGQTRAESSLKAFSRVSDLVDYVAIHDAARCLITCDDIERIVDAAFTYGAATATCKIHDTVKRINNGYVCETLSRDGLCSAQTPQVFKRELYARALSGRTLDAEFTDDNMLLENIGERIYCVEVGPRNMKITTSEDLRFAEYLIGGSDRVTETRIGHGYDVHRFAENRRFVLGGVEISHTKGLLGHSDADVLLHAIMDAILGACGLGDIGRHFPDTSEENKDASSLLLLNKVKHLAENAGYTIVNIDATVVLQRPKIAPYIDEMINNISKMLDIESGRISVKATTEEGLGFTGTEEGVSAHAVALVKK